MAAEVSEIEHLITEALVQQERRLMLRIETHGKAAESAELTLAKRRARRNGAVATSLGAAAGIMLVVFSTAWGIFREYRAAAEGVAVQVVEEKAATLEDRVEQNRRDIDAMTRGINTIATKVDGLATSVAELRINLEEPTEVKVPTPQSRKRPR